MTTSIVTASTGSVVSLAEAKGHLIIDHDLDDTLIASMISSCVTTVENILNRKLLTQTWNLYKDAWPYDRFRIPYGKLQSVTSVKYKGTDGTEYTYDSENYIVDIKAEPGMVVLGYDKEWPSIELYPSNPITIQFVCGYGDAADVPYPIKAAILILIGDLYAHRESIVVGQTVNEIPGYVMSLLGSYRLWGAL